MDGTRAVVSAVGTETHPGDPMTGTGPTYSEFVTEWKTDDEHEWRFPDYAALLRDNGTNMLGYATAHLIFKHEVINTRWAALYHCGNQAVVDRRLESIQCFHCGDNVFAMAPIFDDMDLQRWAISARYDFGTGPTPSDPLAIACRKWGELWFGKWIHNSQRLDTAPTLLAEDKERLQKWLDAFPMVGMYIMHGGSLVSLNPGSEEQGGQDIQEKMPPDETPNGPERTAPDFTPSGEYWYVNDRNAPVRFFSRYSGISRNDPSGNRQTKGIMKR
jgi:hypothetical protein